jgi:two-component system sensor histidine kinase QseC
MRASLRGRLLALALGATVLVWSATVAVTWIDARHEIDEVMDAHLAQAATLLIVQLSEDLAEIEVEHAPLLHKEARRVAFQVWKDGEQLRLHSENAPNVALGGREEGFSDRTVDGKGWRVFTAWDPSREHLVYVGERSELRSKLAARMIAAVLAPLLIALPLLALLLWIAVRQGLRPLDSLASEVGTRAPDNLAPLDAGRAPREVIPLIERLNRLFARMAQSLERERRFTADAAHELRTPVAGIKAQAQVAQLAASAATRDHALGQVVAGADRATRLVEQLLTLARLDTADTTAFSVCRLWALAAEVIADLAPLAAARNVRLELVDGDDAVVSGIPALLQVLIRNLVDNAVRHGATLVRVAIVSGRHGATLTVGDDGPGIPEAERAQVLERFYRLPSAGEGGSGLGLSIVQRIAEIHGAALTLGAGAGGKGLRVEIAFARPAQSEECQPGRVTGQGRGDSEGSPQTD